MVQSYISLFLKPLSQIPFFYPTMFTLSTHFWAVFFSYRQEVETGERGSEGRPGVRGTIMEANN